MRIIITDVHTNDDFYELRDYFIGRTGDFTPQRMRDNSYCGGEMVFDEPVTLPELGIRDRRELYFYGIAFNLALSKKSSSTTKTTDKGIVKCINNEGLESYITSGKLYPIVHESKSYYHIVDNQGKLFYYNKARFTKVT